MLPDEKLHPLQIERFRAMSPSEKHWVFLGMVKTARAISRSALRQRHPDLSDTELDRALAQWVLHGQS